MATDPTAPPSTQNGQLPYPPQLGNPAPERAWTGRADAATYPQTDSTGAVYHGPSLSQYEDPGLGVNPDLDAFAHLDSTLEPVDPAALGTHHVTAVLVAHNGERWLERSLTAIGQLDRTPDRIIAVDTGSRDSTSDLLQSTLGGHAVRRLRKTTGFGEAVAAGVAHADQLSTVATWQNLTEWVWILHDDCAPEPDALRRLLEAAVRRPDAAVIGPKIRGWGQERQLLEVGLTITRGGRRHTGLEKREYDQGQHDAMRDVLAVGSAGMLVRRDVWDELKGFDANLAVFRDDIDFGWRANLAGHKVIVNPDAIVSHAEAAAHGRRKLGATRARVHLVDRRNALYVMLVNAPARRWPLVLLRLLLAAVARAAAFLVGKQPALAAEEVGAVLAVALRPDRIVRARLRRSRMRKVAHEQLRELFPPPGQQLRHTVESFLGVVTGTGTGHDLPSSRRHSAAETGPTDEEEPLEGDSALLAWLVRPAVVLSAVLAVLALVAARGLLGGGRLHGGALFAAPNSAGDLWASYTAPWHGIGLGSDAAVQPYVAVIGGLATLIPSPPVVVDILLLGSVPLSAITAYLVARRLVTSNLLRVWAAAGYGLLPATTGAIAAGRLGTAVAAIVTPLVVLAAMRTFGVRGVEDQRAADHGVADQREAAGQRPGSSKLGPFRAAWSAGLLLAVVTAFVPIAWVAALLVGVAGAATLFRSAPAIVRMLAILAVAPVVLIPWTFEVLETPRLLFTEAGTPGPGLSEADLPSWFLLLAQPGGPGGAPIWLFAGILVAGFIALLRPETLRGIGAAWMVVLVGLAVGLVVAAQAVTGPLLETPVAGWAGYPAVLVGGGLITAAMLAAAGIRNRLRSASFGWRQPLAVALVMIAGITPLVAAGWWVWRGSDTPLERSEPSAVPAYAADESARENQTRTLVLDQHVDGRITYALVRGSGPALGAAEAGSAPADGTALATVVSDLVSGRGGADASGLADFAAQYVYVEPPADPGLVETLDTVSGLRRASAPDGGAMWRLELDAVRVRAIGGPEGDVAIPSGPIEAGGTIPPGPIGRLVVVSELMDPRWTATLDGEPLSATLHNGWAQAFVLPDSGGELAVTYDGAERGRWLWIQLAAIAVAFVLALPGMRRDKGALDDVAEVGTDEIPAQLPVAVRQPGAPLVPALEHAGPPGYSHPNPPLPWSGQFEHPPATYPPAHTADSYPTPAYPTPAYPTPAYPTPPAHPVEAYPSTNAAPGQRADHFAPAEAIAPEHPEPSADPSRPDVSRRASGKASKGGKRAKRRRRPSEGDR